MRKVLVAVFVFVATGCPDGRTTNPDDDTRGEACDRTGPVACMYGVRCGTWVGTQEDCERAHRQGCCERDGLCEDEIVIDDEAFEGCLATIDSATCGTDPLTSDECRSAISSPLPMSDAAVSDADAGPDRPVDGGPPSRLYSSCAGGLSCGGGEDCYVLSYTTTDFACSRPCTGPEDESCTGGHCVRTRTAPRDQTPMDGTAVCLESCTTAGDCTISGWTCVETTTGFRVCLP